MQKRYRDGFEIDELTPTPSSVMTAALAEPCRTRWALMASAPSSFRTSLCFPREPFDVVTASSVGELLENDQPDAPMLNSRRHPHRTRNNSQDLPQKPCSSLIREAGYPLAKHTRITIAEPETIREMDEIESGICLTPDAYDKDFDTHASALTGLLVGVRDVSWTSADLKGDRDAGLRVAISTSFRGAEEAVSMFWLNAAAAHQQFADNFRRVPGFMGLPKPATARSACVRHVQASCHSRSRRPRRQEGCFFLPHVRRRSREAKP